MTDPLIFCSFSLVPFFLLFLANPNSVTWELEKNKEKGSRRIGRCFPPVIVCEQQKQRGREWGLPANHRPTGDGRKGKGICCRSCTWGWGVCVLKRQHGICRFIRMLRFRYVLVMKPVPFFSWFSSSIRPAFEVISSPIQPRDGFDRYCQEHRYICIRRPSRLHSRHISCIL